MLKCKRTHHPANASREFFDSQFAHGWAIFYFILLILINRKSI
jgi:hypothetical protein